MSLTSFIAEKDVKAKLKETFPLARTIIEPKKLIEPRTKNYTLVGTAFDYILRFTLQHAYPHAVDKYWIAELVANPESLAAIANTYGTDIAQQVVSNVAEAKKLHAIYLNTGVMTDALLRAALKLAQTDPYFRAGILPVPYGGVDPEDVVDLRNLYNLLSPPLFPSQSVCLLNPTFGASDLVGGADVDIVLDDMLIDIKTTKFLQIKREYVDQLLGYYILYRIGGITGAPAHHQINTIGIYFARHGYLHTWPIATFVQEKTFPDVQNWFEKRAQMS